MAPAATQPYAKSVNFLGLGQSASDFLFQAMSQKLLTAAPPLSGDSPNRKDAIWKRSHNAIVDPWQTALLPKVKCQTRANKLFPLLYVPTQNPLT